MENLFLRFGLVFLLFLSIGCEKDSPEQQTEEPKPEVPTYWKEWKLPADLPDNFEEVLISTPCWYSAGSPRIGKIIDGKVVVEKEQDIYMGGDNVIFVFDQKGWDSYNFTEFPYKVTTHHRADINWDRGYFLEYKADGSLVFTPNRESEAFSIYTLRPQTQEFLEEKSSYPSNAANENSDSE